MSHFLKKNCLEPLEKKIKITEKDSEIVVTFEQTTPKTKKSPAKPACLNPDWRSLLKSNENSINYGCMFQNIPSSINEKSTTQATLDSFRVHSLSNSMGFEKVSKIQEEKIEQESQQEEKTQDKEITPHTQMTQNTDLAQNMVKTMHQNPSFRRISFEEEDENLIEKKEKETKIVYSGLSRETEEILMRMRERKTNFQKKAEVKCEGMSPQTQEILKQIKAKSSIREQIKTGIEKNVSSHEMPNEFKRIIVKFETFENTLFYFVFRKNPTFFKDLTQET